MQTIVSLALINSVMISVAFKPERKETFFCGVLSLYGIGFLGGGAANLVYFHTGIGTYLRQLIWGENMSMASSLVIMISAGAVCGVVRIVHWLSDQENRQRCCYRAHLFSGERTVTLTAFVDTGNQLREPITGKAVHIAEKSKIAALEQENPIKMLVPFHAVGTEAGLLTALRIDRMELVGPDGQKITLEKPLIGLYEGKLSTQEEYQLLLHAEIETRQGERL